MKFSALVAIVPDDLEDRAIDTAKEEGACGMTLISGRGIGTEERKSFFGLTYEGSQSVLLAVLERRLSLRVLKRLQALLTEDGTSKGVVFTSAIDHIGGIDLNQVAQFEEQIKDEL
ncbi:transcriptional regulator [Natronospirillum operosum]|uniref:Transcriptional regulator n=1 Tax=Natronospirillum operosum TaxID=2759953 RepID=A0A4Z0WD70_9GAMM|nr:transcriptional regulator [Natronospirillum operosum]TGG91762.1 transcriptional regulator [Natronospirillum operosum]